jgi:hypothetical protein
MERNKIMANTYKKPETKVIKVELQQMIAESFNGKGEYNEGVTLGARGTSFDFFMEEEEEAPGKSDDDDDWEDWEEEEM